MLFLVNQFTIAHLEFALLCSMFLIFQLQADRSSYAGRAINVLLAIAVFENILQAVDISFVSVGLVKQIIVVLNAICVVALMSSMVTVAYCVPSLAKENIPGFKRLVTLVCGIAGISIVVIVAMSSQRIDHWPFVNAVIALLALILIAIGIKHPIFKLQPSQRNLFPQIDHLRQNRFIRPVVIMLVVPMVVLAGVAAFGGFEDWFEGKSPWDGFVVTQTIWIIIRSYLFVVAIILFSRYAPMGMRFLHKLIIVFAIGLMLIFNGLALYLGRHLTLSFDYAKAQAAVANPLPVTFVLPELHHYLHDQLWPIAVIAIIANVGLVVVGQLFFNSSLLKPLDTLIEGIGRVRAGELNVRVPIHSGDELGELAGAFNEMISSVDSSQAALLAANANLEDRVAERTQALEQALVSAEKANRAKSLFLAKMSHEFRTPLNAIMGFAQLLEQEHPDARYPATIYNNGHHLLSLVSNVLDVARGEVNQLKLKPEVVDLPLLVQTIVQSMAYKAQGKELTVHYQSSELPTYVMADSMRLHQVLINLLDNAVKFTTVGSVILSVNCSERDAYKANFHFSVADSGSGISQEQIAQIFEPFQQTVDGESFKEGAGLGLAISQQIVGLMGGEIQVESSLGEGSRFWFDVTLPLKGDALSHSADLRFEHVPGGQELKLPTDAIFAQIRASAQIGDVTDIERQLDVLVQQDEGLRAFAEEVRVYSNEYQMQRLRQWLDELIVSTD